MNYAKCPACGAYHRTNEKDRNQPCEMCRRAGQTEWTVRTAKTRIPKWWRREMTNAEKYRTAEERHKAYYAYVENCYKEHIRVEEGFSWLDLEYLAELKPCPFCGGTPVLADNVETMRSLTYYAKCSCGARFASACSKSAAIELWNRRA